MFAKSSPIIETMLLSEQSRIDVPYGISLRSELAFRCLDLASVQGYLHERTDGEIPSIIFGRDERGRHGNFHPDAYRGICANAAWAQRLKKVHTASRRMRLRCNWQWKELDCCSSSDALLMNIFVAALSRHVRKLPASLRRSLTWDRGLEMAKHKSFTVDTKVKVYFCDPQSPWQRGTNENTNGLLRQYFPRKTDLSGYSQADLDKVALRLNQRPRKTLGFETPASKLQASVASTG